MRLTLHFDGSCWPNPGGLAKYGYTLRGDLNAVVNHQGSGFAGEGPSVSNNSAEFFAMAEGLEHAGVLAYNQHNKIEMVTVIGDSEVAIKIMQGRYKANKEKLYWSQYCRAMAAIQALFRYGADVEFKWVPRKQNQEADDLSKLSASAPVSSILLEEAEELLK